MPPLPTFPWGQGSDPRPAVAKSVYEQGNVWRRLAATRVVKVISRIRRTPFLKHPRETTLGEMRLCHVLRHIGEAESGERRIEHLERAVEDELAFDMHLQRVAVFLEFPGVQSAMGERTQIDAVVADQLLRPSRF